jgi:hypothetical protein
MTDDERQQVEDHLAAAAVLYERYLELTRTTIASTADELARQEFYAPVPAPLTLSLTWSDDALVEQPS